MRALVLVDHGSRVPEALATLEAMVALLQARLGAGWVVRGAHYEAAPPDLPSALDACAALAVEIVVCPFFLAPGKHASVDVPRLVAEAGARHPAIRFSVAPPLGADPALAELVLKRAGLLSGRGSGSSP